MQPMQESNIQSFVCFCSQHILFTGEQLVDHIKKCQIYQNSSPFFAQFNKLQIERMLPQHLQALKCEFQVFTEKIDQLLLEKSGNSPRKHIKIISSNIMGSQFQQDQNQNNQQQDLFKTLLQLQKQTVCEVCTKPSDDVNYFEHCFVAICKGCILKQIDQDQKKNKQFNCPYQLCQKRQMQPDELIQIIGREKYEQYQQNMIEREYNIVKCVSCGEKASFEIGGQIAQLKDPITKQNLQQKYIDHYNNNRFTCLNAKCKQEQCKGCKATPYHLGMTCEELKLKKESKCCRYCDKTIHNVQKNIQPALQDICTDKECQEKAQFACQKMLQCGHPCPGFKNEQYCAGCLKEQCCHSEQKGDDYCNICFVEGLQNAPIIQSKCGHIFHYACILKRLDMKWNGPRIVFKFCYCPLCNLWLEFQPSQPQNLLQIYQQLLQDVMKKSLDRLKYENRDKDEKLNKPGDPFYQKPQEYALAIYCYYQCFKCRQPYFGGAKDCQRALEEGDKQFKPEELICANCCEVPVGETCEKHGKDYIEFKCKFCCSIAVWFCWGTTHFCEECHKKQCNGDYVSKYPREKLPKCPGKDKCPLKADHKPNGEEQALGCAICRNARANQMNF